MPAVPEATNRVGDLLGARASLGPAQGGNHAEGAPSRAPVLDLQKGASPFGVDERLETPARRRHREERGLGRVRRRDDSFGQESGRVRVENLGERAARGQRDDEIDLGHPGQGSARPLGEAAGDDEASPGVRAPQAAHETPAVALGAIRHRAAVHEEDVRVAGPGEGRLSSRDRIRERRRVDPADFAAERRVEDASGRKARSLVR